jgi:hypothetical protein
MDAYLKKEQNGTLFVWVGAPEGGFRGRGGRVSGNPAQIWTPRPLAFFTNLLCHSRLHQIIKILSNLVREL